MTRFLSLIAAVLLTLAASAQELAPATFFIDAIAVDGVRYASERVIVAETRLQAGREYTEAEIRAGAARAARLPFVVRVEPRIEKGSQRGAYRLVIAVVETKPLFFGIDYRARDDYEDVRNFTAGARAFLGRSGVLHGAATSNTVAPRYELGYTQYDLFGTGAFVSATVEHVPVTQVPDEFFKAGVADELNLHLVAGMPLFGNNALRATYTNYPTPTLSLTPDQVPIDETYELKRASSTDLTWIYDSTDDPVFTTRGTRGTVTAAVRHIPLTLIEKPSPDPVVRATTDTQPYFNADLRRLWSLAPRHTVSARGGATHTRRDLALTEVVTSGYVAAAYAFTIWDQHHPSRFGDMRLEAALIRQRTRVELEGRTVPGIDLSVARLGVVFRNQWGLIRLRVDWEHLDR